MELISELMAELFNVVDFKLALLIIISSFWVKKNFKYILKRIPMSLKVLVWSTLMAVLYYYIGYITDLFKVGNVINLLITYLFATSFYELLIKPFEKSIKEKINKITKQG